LEEVVLRAGREVWVEVDDSNELIVGDTKGILDQQLRSCRIRALNIIFVLKNCSLNGILLN
jgi:hypothetical protein